MSRESTIQLPDGRKLGYLETGEAQGQPIFYFHGWPGSRLEVLLFEESARQAGVRLIGVDRPGIGLSDFQPDRRVLDWPRDISYLADALQIEQFAVLGNSGGSPFALACAHAIPERVTAIGLVSSLPPNELRRESKTRTPKLFARISDKLTCLMPSMMGMAISFFQRRPEKIDRALRRFMRWMPEADRQVFFRSRKRRQTMVEDAFESFRQGSQGMAIDCALQDGPWGFKLSELQGPELFMWHGEQDIYTPVSLSKRMANLIRGCRVTLYPSDGHISLLFNHAREIFSVLAAPPAVNQRLNLSWSSAVKAPANR